MNKISVLFARQALRSCVITNNQLSSLNRLAFYSISTGDKPPTTKPRKQFTSPLITLLSSESNKLEVMTLDQAKKLADRRQLKLVSIHDVDAKTKRPVYKLMTGSEYHCEEMKKREEKKLARTEQHIKSEKLLTLSNKISEHDLRSKIDKCVKWIQKLHEIRVVISGGDESDTQKTEKIVETIEKEMTAVSGRILQKRMKDGVARFSIMPTIKKEAKLVEGESKKDEKIQAEVTEQKPVADRKLLENVKIKSIDQQIRSHHTMPF